MNALIENFHLLAAAPNGVQKLRELILGLAVRGKLVPQDPNDEPASELLKKIAAEKERLLKEGKIKKGKPLPEIAEDEKPYKLPRGWEWTRFGEIAQHNSGKTLDSGRNTGNPRPYITTSNLYWGRFELSSVRQMLIRDDELEKCTASKNDLLICEGGEAGRAAVWNFDYDISFQNHVHRARFYFGVNPYYAYRFLEKLNATGEINQYRKGVGISNMSSKALASIVLPLPSFSEQQRIAAKVDELMVLCDQLDGQQSAQGEAHERLVAALLDSLTQSVDAHAFAENWARLTEHFELLFDTPESIVKLKQTILQLAVQGNLVPQEQNDEPASELLKKIAAEKARLVEEGKIKMGKPLPEIAEDEKPYGLPQGWEWARMVSCSSLVTDGEHATPQRSQTGLVPLVTAKNVRDGFMDYGNTDFVENAVAEKCWKRCKPEKGDILMVSVGATLGRLSVLSDAKDMVIVRSVTLIRPCFTNAAYLALALKSPLMQKTIWGNTKQMAQPGIYLAQSSSMLLPLPPLAEQLRIVAKVNELMALAERVEARLSEAKAKSAALMDAAVHQALHPKAEVIDLAQYRAAVGCYAIQKMHAKPSFGRTAAAKVVYLAEVHVGLGLKLQYPRRAAGPLTPWVSDFEELGEQRDWFKVAEKKLNGDKTKFEYRPGQSLAAEAAQIEHQITPEQRKELDRLLGLLADKTTEEVEIIATLFAAWNDFLIDGHTPSDDEIIKEVRENWHIEKERFTPTLLRQWLDWLRRNKLVPQGRLPHTVQQHKLL